MEHTLAQTAAAHFPEWNGPRISAPQAGLTTEAGPHCPPSGRAQHCWCRLPTALSRRSSTSLVVWGNLGNRSTANPRFWWCAFVMFYAFISILVGSGGCLSDRCFVKTELKWWEGGCDWKELQNLSVALALRGHSVQPLQLDNNSGSTHYAQAWMPPGI